MAQMILEYCMVAFYMFCQTNLTYSIVIYHTYFIDTYNPPQMHKCLPIEKNVSRL